jgi:glycosyltransferase involved in cell wall biosynthesis
MRSDALFFVSILTPTWNRAAYLQRVCEGLLNQSFRDFEWIVADDGSTDRTDSVVRQLAARTDFPVTYIRADRHVGKVRMDNEAVREARGNFILWCDSDDWLLPNALQRLWETWNSIPAEMRDHFVGITALAATENGCIANPFPDVKYRDVSWNDLAEVYHVTGDMLFCARADALKAHPFPEVDFVIPESVVWTAIGDRWTRFIPEVLKMVEYGSAHAVSFSGTMSYNRGRAYALATTTRNLRGYWRPWTVRAWRLITYIRYSLHGEISPRDALRLWGHNSRRMAFWLAFPLSLALAALDRLRGKVRRTHRELLAAKDNTALTVEVLNAPGKPCI